MKPFLSVCMIVKDEEKVLRRCLESINGLASEIIVVDTGSTDNTKKIALEYTDKVIDYKWEDDFSKARNFAARHAKGDWILVMDADEFVNRDSFKCFISQLQGSQLNENILFVQIVNFVGSNGMSTSLNYHERLYKNDGEIKYYRNVHELLKHENGIEIRGKADLQIYHSGYMKQTVAEKNKSERNLKLLKLIKEKEGIDYYFLGNEYYSLRDFEEAIKCYKKGYQLKEHIYFEWVQKLLIRLIHCLHYTNRNQEAMDVIESCKELYPKTVDFIFLKGKMYTDEWKNEAAINIFEFILANKVNLHAELSLDYLEKLPHRLLGELYEREGKNDLAVFHYSKFLSLNQEDDEIWTKLITLLAMHSSKADLFKFIQKNILSRNKMTAHRFLKILLASQNIEVQQLVTDYDFEKELTSIEKEALKLKNMLLKKEYNLVEMNLNQYSFEYINALLLTFIFDVNDLIIFSMKVNNLKYKTFVRQLSVNPSISNLLNLLYINKKVKLSNNEIEVFIKLYKQVIILDDIELEKILLGKYSLLTKDNQKRAKKEMSNY